MWTSVWKQFLFRQFCCIYLLLTKILTMSRQVEAETWCNHQSDKKTNPLILKSVHLIKICFYKKKQYFWFLENKTWFPFIQSRVDQSHQGPSLSFRVIETHSSDYSNHEWWQRGDRAITGAGAVPGGGCWYYRKPPVPLPGTHTTGHTSHTWYTCHCSPYLPLSSTHPPGHNWNRWVITSWPPDWVCW